MIRMNALSVHAASLCLDVTSSASFCSMTESDIRDAFPDILKMILERQRGIHSTGGAAEASRMAHAIIRTLLLCKSDETMREPLNLFRELALACPTSSWK